jgi:hypothetical protein
MFAHTASLVTLNVAHLDRFSALVDAAASRADDLPALFDYVHAIAGLWERLGLSEPMVDAQLQDLANRERLADAARRPSEAATDREQLAYYALRTLAALQSVVDDWRRRPVRATASVPR